MNDASCSHGKLLRRSLAVPFAIAASLPSVAPAQESVPAQDAVDQAPSAPVGALASFTPVMFPHRPMPFHPPFHPPFPRFHHPFFFVPRPVPIIPAFPRFVPPFFFVPRPVPFHPPFHHWGRI